MNDDNPLKDILTKSDNQKILCSEESIKNFWKYLQDPNVSEENKSKTLNELAKKLKNSRHLCEYFSKKDDEESIYIFLYQLFLQIENEDLKTSFTNFLNELRINIETPKEIYEYIFQKLASFYREEEKMTPDNLNKHLSFLNILLSETDNYQKPRHYFSCNEIGKFEIDLSNEKIEVGHYLTFIINFKINTSFLSEEDKEKLPLASLIKIDFSNGESLELELKYPAFLIMKDFKESFFKTLSLDEWINLVFCLENNDGKLAFYVYVNGENNSKSSYKLPKKKIKPNEQIDSVTFFDNFIGEVSSMIMFTPNSKDSISTEFLSGFKNFHTGVWKRGIFNEFMEFIKGEKKKNIDNQKTAQNLVMKRDTIKDKKKYLSGETKKDISKELIFVFTPINYFKNNKGVIENSIINNSKIKCYFNGNIKNHKYECYQKKLANLGVIPNIIPIAELFLTHPDVLTENNFEVFLNIIVNIINYRKKNIKAVKECKLFQILSLFIEKYPKQLFTEKILENFNKIGRTIFSNNIEGLSKSYFKHILLNEKILSKYSENLQIKFWNQLLLFCQSDKEQIETLFQINRIALILRFYDKNKYTEMCCEKHLNMIKEEYIGSKKIMNPPMDNILSNLENILNVIFDAQEPESAISLFKLLALDLSPCLTKFIINIFINALQKPNKDDSWKDQIIEQLIKCKFEIISINTFVHSLPEIRFEILRLMYEVHNRLLIKKKIEYFTTFEKMLKTCLLPQRMFYSPDIEKPEIIIKDEIFQDYKQKLFESLFMWTLGIKTDVSLIAMNLNKSTFKNLDILSILFILEKDINDPMFTFKFLNTIEPVIKDNKNAITLFFNKKIFSCFLDIAFTNFKNTDSQRNACGNLVKEIILNIFANSLIGLESKGDLFPCYQLEVLFLWGDKILLLDSSCQNNLNEFLNKILTELKKKFESMFSNKFNFQLKDGDSNFYLKNYLMLITRIYRFSFHFIYDLKLNNYGDSFLTSFSLKKNMLEKYIGAMRININEKAKNTISEKWLEYKLFAEIYKKISVIFDVKKIYKKYKIMQNKGGNKILEKYTEILNKVILDKNLKNVYANELKLLCFEEIINGVEKITSLIREIPLFIMNILSLSKTFNDSNNEKEFLYWLKEYKHYILFLIIASANLTRMNQLEFYNSIQEKCIGPILTSICFLRDLSNTSTIFKDKILKTFKTIFTFCLIITKYQYKYSVKHSSGIKKFNLSTKPARNDLKECCVFIIFNDLIKDKKGTSIISLKRLEEAEHNKYVNIEKILDGNEFNESLYENENIKKKLNENFFTLFPYKAIVDYRNFLLSSIGDTINERYKIDILNLLPMYEKELMKYSNNSLEKSIKKKNKYKSIKKYAFSWKGFWSDKNLFFKNIDLLKTKIRNHYTKTLMKPILTPILDISYYLPEFSAFNSEKLFLPTDKKYYKLTLDIDKILKSEQQQNNKINNENITNKEENKEENDEIKENYLRSIYLMSNPRLAESLQKIADNLDFGKEEEFTILEEDSKNKNNDKKEKNIKKSNLFLCCLVKTSHHIKGVCFIDENNLNFKVFLDQKTGNAMNGVELAFTTQDEDYDQDRHTCFGSYFVCHPKDKDLYKISIKYSNIKWIFRRRYYYKNSALEIFTTTNKSFYLNFKFEKDREKVLNDIISKFKCASKIIDDLKENSNKENKDNKDPFENIIGYENSTLNKINNFTNIITRDRKTISDKKMNTISRNSISREPTIKLSRKVEQWQMWEISNFEFLMWLNIYGNRSYNDISQYPVFPWILANYEDPLKKEELVLIGKDGSDEIVSDFNYRDLNLPMGMLELNDESIKRKELFLETYDTLINEEEQEIKPYIYGSNYSNPVYVCNYLTRLFPFTHIAIELQGHGFDDPNRLFFSVKHSFNNSITQKTDVRELIPEFFYLPEIFININELNMGIADDGNMINDVLTPCNGNPYDFIMTMKNALENNYISYSIHNWIDLIFGYKAKGKDAEIAKNLFTEASYQENIDINKYENKEAYLRMVEFGLIPNQIMSKECLKREKKENINKMKEITDPMADLYKSSCFIDTKEKNIIILKIATFLQEKLIIVQSNGLILEKSICFSQHDKEFVSEIINKIDINNVNNNCISYLYSTNVFNKAIKFLYFRKIVILGGYYDGKIVIAKLDNRISPIEAIPFNDESPILSIESDKNEQFIFLGNSIGNILVYEINENGKWVQLFLLTDQIKEISHIFCNNELNLWASASKDGYICLYTLPLCKLIRCIKVSCKNCSYVFLSDSPLPCIIVICDEESNSNLFVYSINGKLLYNKQEYVLISNPVITKDLNDNDYLAYIGKENVVIRNIPNLNAVVTVESLNGIYSLCISPDNTTMYTINENGSEVTVVKEEANKKNLRNASFVKV